MKKLVKDNRFKLGILIVIILVVVFAFIKKMPTDQGAYGKGLWNRLSQGDVSSTACQKAISEYQSQDPLSQTRIFESFYSYKKKRCLGLDIRNFNGSDGKYAGHTDKIFDLIIGDTIVACTLDYSKEWQSHLLTCSDSQNAWTADNDSKIMPPPFPIFSGTWTILNTLGKE